MARKRIAGALQSNRPSHAPGRRALYMLPAAPEADELQQLPLELPRYLLVMALREPGGHRAYALLLPHCHRQIQVQSACVRVWVYFLQLKD